MSEGEIRAPFTAEQQLALDRWQNDGAVHPFTCPNGHGPLVVGPHWWCRHCVYVQNWAHAIMASGFSAPTLGAGMSDDATGVPDTAAAMIAEQWARQHARDAYDSDLDDYGRQMLAVLIAEYDRRGAALAYATELGGQAIRAEAQAVRDLEAELVGVRSECDRLREIERQYAELRDAAAAVWPGIQAMVAAIWPRIAAVVGVDPDTGAALAGSGTAGDTPPSQSVHDAAMKAAVRARDEWRAAEQGPIEGHPDGPECLAIAEAVLDVVRSAESGAGWPGLGVRRKSY